MVYVNLLSHYKRPQRKIIHFINYTTKPPLAQEKFVQLRELFYSVRIATMVKIKLQKNINGLLITMITSNHLIYFFAFGAGLRLFLTFLTLL